MCILFFILFYFFFPCWRFSFFFYFILFKFTILYWFCHISTWIRHRYTHVPHPEPSSLPIPSLWVVPVHQPQASGIVHQTWTGDSFHIWYYACFNAILPNHPTLSLSHRVHKTVLYICVSFAISHTGLSLPFSKFHIYVLVYYIGVFLSGLLHSVCILNTHLFILKITNHFNWFSFISVLQNFFHLFSPHLSFFYPTNKYQIPLSTVYLFICSVLEYTESVSENLTTEKSKYWEKQAC